MEEARAYIRVLVADDSAMARKSICDFLDGRGNFKIVGTASGGAQLLEEAVRLQPDLVLADFHMKELNGLEATRELRRMFPSLRVVILSGLDSRVLEDESAQSGADAFIEKSELSEKLIPVLLHLFPGTLA